MGNDTCKTCQGDGEAYIDFKYQRCPDCRPTADEEIAALLVQVADFKERADIADSIHKEMMEKLERYRKALEYVVENVRGYHIKTVARDALAK